MREQGGYFCRAQHLAGVHLPDLARKALLREGIPPEGIQLIVARTRMGGVVRLTFEPTPGGEGARWYSTHPALAELLSAGQSLAVHAYALLPSLLEEVVAFADGRRVGGDRVRYDEVEPTDEELADDALFERLQDRWPLGRLAQVLGLTRKELQALARRGEVARLSL